MNGQELDAVSQSEAIYAELAKLQNITSEPLYDRLVYAPAQTDVKKDFFNGGSTKTTTNLVKARELPQNHMMIVEEIQVSFGATTTASDAKTLLSAGAVLEFAPNDSARSRFYPLDMLGAGGGLSSGEQNGVVQKNAVFRLRRPEVLRGGIPFKCNIQHAAAAAPANNTDVQVRFVGLYGYPAAEAAS